MEHPIIVDEFEEDGKKWPVWHPLPVCAKNNKLAQECFRISGCEGECLQHVETIAWDDGPEWTKGDSNTLYVLNTVIIFN